MIKKTFALLFLLYSASFAEVGGSSFEFLLVGSSSRASAMGEAFSAVSGDAGAPYFNPASAGVMNGSEVSFAHLVYLEDASIEQLSALTRSGKMRLGLNMSIGQVADFERRDDRPTTEPLGTFDEHNFALSIFWAYPISPDWSVGNALKFAYEKLDYGSATAVGTDLGIFYTFDPQIAFGASVRNLGSRPKFISRSYDLPRELRLGFSYRGAPESPLDGILFAADYILPKWGNGDSKLNFGGEYNYDNFVFFRSGYNLGYDSRSFAIGGGLAYRIYYIDYAYVIFRHNLSNTHRITMRIRL
ncbi:MAG: PorV/PorQ family protein [Candidatus Zixiibacteriota bacterium]|nr:MAG: PorV/PorQ family protein [candidate division Zixibacteria bacterium]